MRSSRAPSPDYAFKLRLWNGRDFLRMTGQFFVYANVGERGSAVLIWNRTFPNSHRARIQPHGCLLL